MKLKKYGSALAFASIVLASTSAYSETLAIGSGVVAPGATAIAVPITINDASNVAGAAFTINYDSAMTFVGVTSSFFGTFSAQNITPTSVTIGDDTYTQPLITSNDGPAGKAMVAAARVAPPGNNDLNTLVTAFFNIPGGAANGTVYNVSVVQSIIDNAAAGYQVPTNIDILIGYDDAGPTYPVAPVTNMGSIIGALTVSTIDADGDGIADAWESQYSIDMTATSDSDGDGYSDLQEFTNMKNGEVDPSGNPYDPTVVNAPGGTNNTTSEDKVNIVPILNMLLMNNN